jgi:hypothetical protein
MAKKEKKPKIQKTASKQLLKELERDDHEIDDEKELKKLSEDKLARLCMHRCRLDGICYYVSCLASPCKGLCPNWKWHRDVRVTLYTLGRLGNIGKEIRGFAATQRSLVV